MRMENGKREGLRKKWEVMGSVGGKGNKGIEREREIGDVGLEEGRKDRVGRLVGERRASKKESGLGNARERERCLEKDKSYVSNILNMLRKIATSY